MNYIIIFGLTCVLSLLIRLFMVYINRSFFTQGFVGDSSIHFGIIKQLKSNRKSTRIEQYVIPNQMTYPLGFHRIISVLPLSLLKKYSYIPNVLIFSIASSVYFTYLHYVTKEVLEQQTYRVLIITAIIYFFSVSNLLFTGPEITYLKLSERLLARVSNALYFLCLSVDLIWGDTLSLVLAAIFGALALLSSTFARQSIFFITPLLSLLFFDAIPLLTLSGSFIIAYAVGRTYFLNSVKHTVLYWNIYETFVKNSSIMSKVLSNFFDYRVIIRAIRKKTLRGLSEQFLRREPIRLFIYFPEFLLLILGLYLSGSTEAIKLMLPILAISIIYLLTTTKRFNHLGEAYRYFEYSGYFYIPMTIAILFHNNTEPIFFPEALIGYVLFTFFVVFTLTYIYVYQTGYPPKDLLTEFLEQLSLSKDDVVFPVSMRLGGDITARIDVKSFWWQPGGITEPELYKEYLEEYPFLKKDWKDLFEKHHVTHVICDKKALSMIEWEYNLSSLTLIKEDGNYIAYYA